MDHFKRLFNLHDHVALIVGGTGQVGSATALRLASQGARIVLLVKTKNLQKAFELIKQLPSSQLGPHVVFEADVLDSASLNLAASRIREEVGRCDILINAAGFTQNAKPNVLDELSDDLFEKILNTNLRGVFSTIRAFHGLLIESGRGVIVNISSTASLRASQSNLAYSAAKAGLNLMTQSLAKAFAPTIRVIAVVPGYLEAPTSGANKSSDFNEIASLNCPLKRIGFADDVASTIEACLTTIRFSTGSLFIIDGGRTL